MPPIAQPPGLIQRYRELLQTRHYLRFHRLRHPREMGSAEVNAFLTHLPSSQRRCNDVVSASLSWFDEH
jgi:hypothetical protein